MKGFLGFLILWVLSSKGPMHGDALAEEIGKRKGGNKPAPGTIYPALRDLEKKGLVKPEKKGKTVVYSLTSKGKTGCATACARFCSMFGDVFRKVQR